MTCVVVVLAAVVVRLVAKCGCAGPRARLPLWWAYGCWRGVLRVALVVCIGSCEGIIGVGVWCVVILGAWGFSCVVGAVCASPGVRAMAFVGGQVNGEVWARAAAL